jgi:hypothetical protein
MTLRSLMREGRVVKGRGLQESQLPTFSLRGQPNFAWHRGGINQPGSVGSLYYTCTSSNGHDKQPTSHCLIWERGETRLGGRRVTWIGRVFGGRFNTFLSTHLEPPYPTRSPLRSRFSPVASGPSIREHCLRVQRKTWVKLGWQFRERS